jgi:ankyrin repeat protein
MCAEDMDDHAEDLDTVGAELDGGDGETKRASSDSDDDITVDDFVRQCTWGDEGVDAVEEMLSAHPSLISQQNESGHNGLHMAAANSALELMRWLLAQSGVGDAINAQDIAGTLLAARRVDT